MQLVKRKKPLDGWRHLRAWFKKRLKKLYVIAFFDPNYIKKGAEMKEKTVQEEANSVFEWQRKIILKDRLREFLTTNKELVETVWNDCEYFEISPLIIFRNSGDESSINYRIRAVVDDIPFNVIVHHNNSFEIEEDSE